MKLAVLGTAARDVGAVAARHPGVSEVVAIDVNDDVSGGDWLGVVVSADTDGAARLARAALTAGHRVLLVGTPAGEHAVWSELAESAPDRLSLSRPSRFDPHIARASEVVRAGTVGAPRTLEICWSFGDGADATAVATELVDVACLLLDGGPASVYAVACEVAGPPLVKVNLLAANGAIAAIEATGESDDFPIRRDLHLLATNGEIVHRIGQDDLLWREGRAEPLPGASGIDELRAQEIAAWLEGGDGGERLARGAAVGWNLRATKALSRSLAGGEMVSIGEEVGRS
jgi:predicted dehydrogenase